MSAGDLTYIGWIGDPITKELTARVSIAPQWANGNATDTTRKRIVRRLLCFDKDKQSVIQALQNNASLSLPVINPSSGSVESQSFGGGWNIIDIGDSEANPGICLLTVTYEKEVSTLFELNFPTGVTLTDSAGVITLAYNATPLMTWDSGTGVSTSGLQLLPDLQGTEGIRALFDGQGTGTDPVPQIVWTLYAHGVKISSHPVRAVDLPDSVAAIYKRERITGREVYRGPTYSSSQSLGERTSWNISDLDVSVEETNQDELTSTEIEEIRTDYGASAATSVLVTTYETLAYVNTDDGKTYTYRRKIITQYIDLEYTKTVPGPLYGAPSIFFGYDANRGATYRAVKYSLTGRILSPSFKLSNNLLSIDVGGFSIMEWDVTGL